MTNDRGRALLVVMPLEDLRSARALDRTRGSVVLPAGGPGDLDLVAAGTHVLLMATDPEGDDVPAATWRGELIGRLPHAPGDPFPHALPPTWLERHGAAVSAPAVRSDDAEPSTDEEDEERDEDSTLGPQAFFEITDLHELPKHEWLFVNELVGKQARGGRTFFPRVPMIVAVPD